ncbi:MAG: tRNA (adenosine(37)-N6)-dimethylallyltransferase MiaA, partial [Myxococcota bacterium]
MIPLVAVVGPTATGKTRLALRLARHFGGEIVGADSVQVYRGFDIGSAKPTSEELGEVAHHLIDVVDPEAALDAKRYAELADHAIRAIVDRGNLPIVVGGTGLWLRALLLGLVDVPPVNETLRESIEAEVQRLGPAASHRRLRDVDPLSAEAIHPNDALRIVRALEVHTQTGRPLGELRRDHARGGPRYRALVLALDAEKASLRSQMDERTNRMFRAGWCREVMALLERHPRTARAFGSVGYRQLVEHLIDGVPPEETLRRIRKATWVYSKRQRTWF